jgi:uncharacterized protein
MTAELQLPPFAPLTLAERRDLLSLARESIRAALQSDQPPIPAQLTPALDDPGAAFVSLHEGTRLRGCIGTLTADRPLYLTVSQMAVAAACDDPRFPPLSLAELAAVVIEISRLGPLIPALPGQVCPGRHGVCLHTGERRGVFLPQVALQYHWDRETLLRELCLKALLPPDAWLEPDTTLMVFEAEVFGEG